MDESPRRLLGDPELARFVDQLGLFFDRFGFRRNLGRVWAVLYVAPTPLDQAALAHATGLSQAFVSSALKELERWGAVHAVATPGVRRVRYQSEERLLRIVANILSHRELTAVQSLREAASAARASCRPAGFTRRLHHRLRSVETVADLYERLAQLVIHASSLPDDAIAHLGHAVRAVRHLFGRGRGRETVPRRSDEDSPATSLGAPRPHGRSGSC